MPVELNAPIKASAVLARRALDSGQKQAKRESILTAARLLYEQCSSELPSAAAIADAAGLAKGTVYLYFRSKEDIFLALLSCELAQLIEQLHSAIAPISVGRELIADRFAASCAAWMREHPLLLQLSSISYGAMMRGATPQSWVAMRSRLVDDLAPIAQVLEARTHLSYGQSLSLLTKSYGLMVGLYQSLHYPPALKALLSSEELAKIQPDFWLQFNSGLRHLWRGALSQED